MCLHCVLQAVDARYANADTRMGPDQEVVFEGEKITLDIPEDGLKLESGWTITPHTHPGVIHMLLCLESCILGLQCLFFSCYIGCKLSSDH